MTNISIKRFGQFKGSEVILATLSGDNTSISFMNWGAAIQNWTVNHSTKLQNSVVLGFENFDFYPKFSPYFGSIVGRVINRINQGRFELNGINYQLDVNRSPNHLHGGITGFGKSIWDFETDEKENSITFSIKSNDGDGGYPGNVNVKAKYKLAGKKLTIEISATVDRETPLNMGQHNYFNLCSQSEENYNICNHLLYLNAASFNEIFVLNTSVAAKLSRSINQALPRRPLPDVCNSATIQVDFSRKQLLLIASALVLSICFRKIRSYSVGQDVI